MMLNIYEYALSLSWSQTRTERGYESHYPPWILVNVVNVRIEINESH